MGEELAAASEASPAKSPEPTKVGNWTLVAYMFGIFALPPIGYYATLATFKVPSAGMGFPLMAWLFSLSMPTYYKVANKPLVPWQILLLAELFPLAGYLFPSLSLIDPQYRLMRLAIDATLTPLMVWQGLRIGRYLIQSTKSTTPQDESRNLVHRIHPESQPEDVVNVSQK